jgi:hypothetical protein
MESYSHLQRFGSGGVGFHHKGSISSFCAQQKLTQDDLSGCPLAVALAYSERIFITLSHIFSKPQMLQFMIQGEESCKVRQTYITLRYNSKI